MSKISPVENSKKNSPSSAMYDDKNDKDISSSADVSSVSYRVNNNKTKTIPKLLTEKESSPDWVNRLFSIGFDDKSTNVVHYCMFDWGAKVTNISFNICFPLLISTLGDEAFGDGKGRILWSYIVVIMSVITALSFLTFTSVIEYGLMKRKSLFRFALVTSLTLILFFVCFTPGSVYIASIFTIIAKICQSIASMAYDSLLDAVSTNDNHHIISSRAIITGYTGIVVFIITAAPVLAIFYFSIPGLSNLWLQGIIPLVLTGIWYLLFLLRVNMKLGRDIGRGIPFGAHMVVQPPKLVDEADDDDDDSYIEGDGSSKKMNQDVNMNTNTSTTNTSGVVANNINSNTNINNTSANTNTNKGRGQNKYNSKKEYYYEDDEENGTDTIATSTNNESKESNLEPFVQIQQQQQKQITTTYPYPNSQYYDQHVSSQWSSSSSIMTHQPASSSSPYATAALPLSNTITTFAAVNTTNNHTNTHTHTNTNTTQYHDDNVRKFSNGLLLNLPPTAISTPTATVTPSGISLWSENTRRSNSHKSNIHNSNDKNIYDSNDDKYNFSHAGHLHLHNNNTNTNTATTAHDDRNVSVDSRSHSSTSNDLLYPSNTSNTQQNKTSSSHNTNNKNSTKNSHNSNNTSTKAISDATLTFVEQIHSFIALMKFGLLQGSSMQYQNILDLKNYPDLTWFIVAFIFLQGAFSLAQSVAVIVATQILMAR